MLLLMSKITKLALPKKGDTYTMFLTGDWHTEALDISTYKIFLSYIKKVPRSERRLVINGDFLDCEHLMLKGAELKQSLKLTNVLDLLAEQSADEFLWGNNILDELQKYFDFIYFNEGNHDWRYRNFMRMAPFAYKHNFDYESRLHLKERGIPVVYYNDWMDVGRLSVTHGMWHNATALEKHAKSAGWRNVVYSHVHKSESKCLLKRNDTIKAYSLPAMCNLAPEYLKNKDGNWMNGFGEATFFDDGSFSYHNHDVINEKLAIQGKIYTP